MSNALPHRRTGIGLRIALLGAVPICVLVAVVSMYIFASRVSTIDHAAENARQLVRTLEASVSATMQSAEIVLNYVVADVAERSPDGRTIDPGLLDEFIKIADGWPSIQSVAFTGTDGHALNAVFRGAEGNLHPTNIFAAVDLRSRETYSSHESSSPAEDKLYVSSVRQGNVTNTRVIILTRGIWEATGRFLGVASVAVRQDAIEKLFKTATPIKEGAISLFRSDATLLFATPKSRLTPGVAYPNTWLFRTAVHRANEDSYDNVIAEDGVERIFAYRTAPRYPFVVAVAIPKASVLGDWRQSTTVLIIASLLSALVIGMLTASLIRRFRINAAVQSALRESESKLQDLIECSTDFQWETDAVGNVTGFGGYGIEKFISLMGRRFDTFFGSSSDPHDLSEFRNLLAWHQSVRHLRIPVHGREGGTRWVRMSCNPLFDADGVFKGYRGVGADITEIRRQRDVIEAERKNEALGRLASGLAHEINNLLQPILIYAGSGAAQKDGDAVSASYFSRIRRAAENASAIVKNVLTFSRQGPPRKTQIELTEVVRETVDLLAARIPATVTVRIDIPSESSSAWVDRTGCAQALTNLITNGVEAIAAKPGGEGCLTISASSVLIGPDSLPRLGLRPGEYCRLSVTDDGPGIRQEDLKHIFDPFYTTKPQSQGTGLGLSVVAGLTKSWGGAVDVTSRLGEKTEFSLYLPSAERQMQAAQ